MRLIDADVLESIIKNEYCIVINGQLAIRTEDGGLKPLLPEMPTAYDVEEVVAELNKAESVKTFGSLNSGNRLIPVKDAINIVKKGGIPAAEQEEGE